MPALALPLALALALALLTGPAQARTRAGSPAAQDPSAQGSSGQSASGQGSPGWASAKAIDTGKRVPVTAATTATSTLAANPDGTFTLTQAPQPVRKKVDGGWVDLDATLTRTADGGLTAKSTTLPARLSGGGTGPLATLTSQGHTLAVSAPMPLPAPTISAATATYPGVLPGVDLQASVDAQGGVSTVLVIHNARAAANPALKTLTFATGAAGLHLATDTSGNLTATDAHHHPVFAAPAPTMWDSATPAATTATTRDRLSGQTLTTTGGHPETSTPRGPGTAATVRPLKVTTSPGRIHLTPDPTMLTDPATIWPVYLDPSWSAVGASRTGWATITKTYPSTNYWKSTPDPQGYLQVGNGGSITSRTLLNFPVSPVLAGATIHSAALSLTENWSWSCTPSVVNVYAPATTLTSSNATWKAWSGVHLGPAIASANVAHGYSSACPAAGVGFNVKTGIAAAIAAHRSTQTFALIAGNESSTNSWKEFLAKSPTLSITYNHPPNQPTGLSTSPPTSCPTTATPTTVGDADVMLNAPVSDPDANRGGTLNVTFTVWKTSDTTRTRIYPPNSTPLVVASGSIARLNIPQATLESAAAGNLTRFSWHVQVSDIAAAHTSATCTFAFDASHPGKPGITDPPADGTTTVGQPVTVHITPPTSGALPGRYLYQLNAAGPGSIPADTATGNAALTITPTRLVNTLTVISVSPTGNIGDQANPTIIISGPPATTTPGDLTGDGATDLLTVGGTHGLPAGLWQAEGKNNGQASPNATDIGANGDGSLTTNSPNDFTGAQAITGHFTDSGVQDILTYYPHGHANGANTGGGMVLRGTGDGTTLQTQQNQNATPIRAGTLTDLYGLNPLQIADAGNTSGQSDTLDDLIAISGNSANGYYLDYYPDPAAATFGFPYLLTNTTPTGGTDWNNWQIATTQTSGKTAIYLWNHTTGGLYLWTDLTFTDNGDLTATLTIGHQYTIHTSGWNSGNTLTLHAADLNTDTTPDLWATTGPTITAYLLTNPDPGTTSTSGTATLTAQPAQTLTTAAHSWALSDVPADTGGGQPVDATNPANDSVSDLDLTATATGTARWNTGGTYSPDVTLTGTGALTTTGPAINTSHDFSVSAWIKPDTIGGVVLSQEGHHHSGAIVYTDHATGKWVFGMAHTDATSGVVTDYAIGSPVRTGLWAHLLATFDSHTNLMRLYVNGVEVAATTHTTRRTSPGAFHIGDFQTADNHTSPFTGEISQIETWNQVVDPAQNLTPAGYYQPVTPTRILDTRHGTGGTTGPVTSGATVKLKVTGIAGVPAKNVTAIAVNLTAVAPTANGNVVAYPDDTPRPVSNILTYLTGSNTAHYALLPVGANGSIDLDNTGGSIHLLADVSGYFTTDPAATGNTTYTPLHTPTRILDTRHATGAPQAKLGPASTLTLPITGNADIPTSGVTAVAMNLTTVGATTNSWLAAYADATPRPAVSGLQFGTWGAAANTTIVPVGTNGKIDIFNAAGSTDIIGDVLGYFTTGTNGQKYHATGYTRIIDTRQTGGPIGDGATLRVAQGNTVIANNPTLILNIIAVNETGTGYLLAHPDDTPAPATSNVNYYAGRTVSNLALVPTGTTSTINVTSHGATLNIIVDCFGYFAH